MTVKAGFYGFRKIENIFGIIWSFFCLVCVQNNIFRDTFMIDDEKMITIDHIVVIFLDENFWVCSNTVFKVIC